MQIIDGFTVNAAQPIDDRLVTSGTASRNAIVYKYNGLRVYDIVANQPYVWNGTIWTSENSSTVTITGTTLTGYIPTFEGTSQIKNSLISQETVGAGKYINIATGNYTLHALKVAGIVQATGFRGLGTDITNILGSNITGPVAVSKLSPKDSPTAGEIYILKSGTATPEWMALSSIPANSLPASAPSPDSQTLDALGSELYVSFGTKTGQYKYYQTSSGDAFKFVPKTTVGVEGAQLQIPSGTEANPSIAFSTNKNTGVYKPGFNVLGISVAGKEKMRFTENGALLKASTISEATFKILNTGGRPFIGLYGLDGDSKMSGTIGFSGLWNNGGRVLEDFIIESFASNAAKSYPQTTAHFDANVPAATDGRRHMINMNGSGQTIIATNVGAVINSFTGGVPSSAPSTLPNGQYGCDIYNSNPSMGHGLIVRSGGGPNTVSARFDNGSKTIAYFTDRGLQILSGSETAPAICFDADRSTGIYLETAKRIGIVAGGKKVLTLSDTEIRLPKVSNLAFIFGDNTRIEGTTRTNSLEIYRPTTSGGYAICHFYSDIGGTKSAKAYIWPDGVYYRLSDRNQKENIKELEYGLSEVLRLNPVTHTWLYSDATTPSIGLIAQEVEEVLKELVNTSMDGDREVKALDYNGLIPVLIKSIQELNKKIEILEAR